jgi:hypothetical protein
MLVKQHPHRPAAAEIHATLSSQSDRPRVYCMLDDAVPSASDERPTTQMRALARER